MMKSPTRQVRLLLLVALGGTLVAPLLGAQTEAGTLVFTQVGSGVVGSTAFRTVFCFRNENAVAAGGELEFYSSDGSPMPAPFEARWTGQPGKIQTEGHHTEFEIPPVSSLNLHLLAEPAPRIGWARLAGRDEILEASAFFQYGESQPRDGLTDAFENTLRHEAESLPLGATKDFSFPISLFRGSQEINTAFAFVNLSAKPASVEVTLRPNHVREITLEPGQLLSAYFTQFWDVALPAVFPLQVESAAEVHSVAPIAVAVFRTLNGVPLSGVPVSLVSTQSETSPAELGTEFELSYGQTASIESEGLQVTFWNVVEDSRCPTQVVCIWEGQARIVLRIRQGDQVKELELVDRAGNRDLGTGQVGNYTVHLLGLEPYPEAPGTIDLQDYKARLTVETKP